jgi:hypothetical protein
MSGDQDSEPRDPREIVQNFEPVWDFEPRVFSLGDVPTPPKGIRQTTVAYVVGAVVALLIGRSMHVFSWVFALLPWWLWGASTVAATAVLAVVEVQGLRAHKIIPILAGYLASAKHLHGWEACAPDGARWRMGELALIPDGSEPEFSRMSYTGPGLILRTREAERTPRQGRHRRHGVDLTLTELPGAPLAEPRITRVPAGRTVAIRPRVRVEPEMTVNRRRVSLQRGERVER